MANGVTLPNERDLLRRYGLTLARYVEFLESQGGVCRVCRKPPHDGKPLVVDHDHDPPRQIWGLVHGSPCNRALTQDARRYIRTPPAVEQYVPDELEAQAIGKREREKLAARDRRAAAAEAKRAAEARRRAMTSNGSRLRELTRPDPAADAVRVDEALAATAAPPPVEPAPATLGDRIRERLSAIYR